MTVDFHAFQLMKIDATTSDRWGLSVSWPQQDEASCVCWSGARGYGGGKGDPLAEPWEDGLVFLETGKGQVARLSFHLLNY